MDLYNFVVRPKRALVARYAEYDAWKSPDEWEDSDNVLVRYEVRHKSA
jgi:hypothetical protein